MCLNPRFIPNVSKARYGGLPYIAVPCRNCPECSNVAQQDYLVRTIVLLNTLPLNYSFFFCTLTYNNENLPRTNVYYKCSIDGKYHKVKSDVPTFNHEDYKRFRKNFCEYCQDKYNQKCYILTTSQYGDNNHRPHYHCIIAVPFPCNYRYFKSVIERFWHYGFTKNIGLARIDGQEHLRSPLNCIKYVVRYVCRYEQPWLPDYLKPGFATDLPPYVIKPKTFISNGYGSALEQYLTEGNFRSNSVFISCRAESKKQGQSYQLPQYYRRRHFVETEVLEKWKIPFVPGDEPYKVKKRWIYKSHTRSNRKPGYSELLFDKFKSSIRQQVHDLEQLINSDPNFVTQVFENDRHKEFVFDKERFYKHMEKVYSETYSLSPAPSFCSHREKISKLQYKKYHWETDRQTFLRIKWRKEEQARLELPWINAPTFKFETTRSMPFTSLPEEYGLLQFAQQYLRCKKYTQYQLKEYNQQEWYRLHCAV